MKNFLFEKKVLSETMRFVFFSVHPCLKFVIVFSRRFKEKLTDVQNILETSVRRTEPRKHTKDPHFG